MPVLQFVGWDEQREYQHFVMPNTEITLSRRLKI
jgi:hypothetical protein